MRRTVQWGVSIPVEVDKIPQIQQQLEMEDSPTVYMEVKSFGLCLIQVDSHKTSSAVFYGAGRQNASKTY